MTAIVVFDIDGVLRDVAGSYRRAIADTVEKFTENEYRPSALDIDELKSEGLWNNDWEASQELIYRYWESQGKERSQLKLNYNNIVDFFQCRYQGTDPENWHGYICEEPLLLHPSYLEKLSLAGIGWGFFSGAPRAEAMYLLEKRLGLKFPVLIAMEDAPSKPDPTGLLAAVEQLEKLHSFDDLPSVIYVGDTVADMYTVKKAQAMAPHRTWLGVGVLPPHIHENTEHHHNYVSKLMDSGAIVIFNNVQELTPIQIETLIEFGI